MNDMYNTDNQAQDTVGEIAPLFKKGQLVVESNGAVSMIVADAINLPIPPNTHKKIDRFDKWVINSTIFNYIIYSLVDGKYKLINQDLIKELEVKAETGYVISDTGDELIARGLAIKLLSVPKDQRDEYERQLFSKGRFISDLELFIDSSIFNDNN